MEDVSIEEKVDPQDEKFQQYSDALKKMRVNLLTWMNPQKGGRADKREVLEFDLDQLLQGIKIEHEHTSDPDEALKIAMDHLSEIPDYYTRLEKMEREAGVNH